MTLIITCRKSEFYPVNNESITFNPCDSKLFMFSYSQCVSANNVLVICYINFQETSLMKGPREGG